MGLPRKTEDLSVEPSLREALADPVIQALMRRDAVSQEELLRLIAAVRARLLPAHEAPLPEAHEAIVMPFPRREPPSSEDLRPRTRWPFCVAPAGGAPALTTIPKTSATS